MSWWQALAAGADALFGMSAAEEQMDFNAEQAKLNRQFQERMSNTEVQRRKADLEKAGFNPMMAVMNNAASAPSGSAASSGAMPRSEFSSAASMAAMNKAQIELLQAQADKARSEAQVARDFLPHSATTAQLNVEKLDAEVSKVANDVKKQLQDYEIGKINLEQAKLVLEAQRLINEGKRLGLSEARASSAFYESVGGATKWAELVRHAMGIAGHFSGPR